MFLVSVIRKNTGGVTETEALRPLKDKCKYMLRSFKCSCFSAHEHQASGANQSTDRISLPVFPVFSSKCIFPSSNVSPLKIIDLTDSESDTAKRVNEHLTPRDVSASAAFKLCYLQVAGFCVTTVDEEIIVG